MSLELQKSISSLIDDELDASACDELLAGVNKDDALKKKVARYSLISGAIKKDLPENIGHNLFERVSTVLASEPPLVAPHESVVPRADVVALPQKPPTKTHFSPAFGFGIAASLTLVAVLGFQMFTGTNDLPQKQNMANVEQPATQSIQIVQSPPVVSSPTTVGRVLVTNKLSSVAGTVIYAEQSLINDGQWTRISNVDGIPLQRFIFSDRGENREPFIFQSDPSSMARSVKLENRQ